MLGRKVSTRSQITDLTKKLENARVRIERERRRANAAERKLSDRSLRSAPLVDFRPERPSTSLLAERFILDSPVPTPAQALQGQRNGEARWEMLQEFGAYSSDEIAKRRSRAKNPYSLASRWRREGKIFSVSHMGKQLFPGFQFDPDTLNPHRIIAVVLSALPREDMSDWEVALWWTADNGWLDGRRPVDLIDEDPDSVAAVAKRLAEPTPL
jgi:hypothetical protein